MSYRIAISLRIAHDYWGDDTIPLQIRPSDPGGFRRLDLLSKPSPAQIDIIADEDEIQDSQAINLDVVASDPNIYALTDGADWAQVPLVDLTNVTSDREVSLSDVPIHTDAARQPGDPLLRVNLSIPAEGTHFVTLRLSAVSTLWAYHVTGNKVDDPLQVIDKNNGLSFEDLGKSALPDGDMARIFRSSQPIPLRYRPDASFTLEARQDPPFDPITLIPVLPAAGVNLRPTPDPAAGAPLQSDIFVSLW